MQKSLSKKETSSAGKTDQNNIELAQYKDFAEASAEYFWETDTLLNITKTIGTAKHFNFTSLSDMANASYSQPANVILKAMQRYQPFSDYVVQVKANTNKLFYYRVCAKPVYDQNKSFIGYRGASKDITETIVSNQRVEFLASHDGLTGLPNRNMFRQRLEHAITKAKRLDHQLLLIYFNLDYFKMVNDVLGQEAGDQLLVFATERISGCARATDVLCRLGSDEFVMVMEGASPEDGHRILRAVIDAFSSPFHINEQQLYCTVSMGVSVFPDDTVDPEALLVNADLAMARAKQSGRNNFEFYTTDLNETARQWFDMANDIRHGLDRGLFFLVYQPQMHGKTEQIVGLEALLRWRHPERGLIPPLEFFNVAEKSLLIDQIGALVLEMSCAQMRQWLDAGYEVPRISIKVSTRYLRSETLIDSLNSITLKYNISPDRLCIQIVESALIDDLDNTKNNIHAIKAAGYYLSLDDFGIGYSSLTYLKRKIVDEVKIDQALVRGIKNNIEDRVIIKAIANLSKVLGFNLVAGGVENKQESMILAKAGYKIMQGYFFAPPLLVEEVLKKLNLKLK